MPKRVQVAKKEELLGEDTSRIDQAEYKLQSLISPETHEAGRFFNKPPSKEIGNLRVDTMSPAQVSFIQSSTQWHKYFKPSTPAQVPSNIFPDDPVLFPGMKPFKGSESEAQGYIGGELERLENAGLPKHHPENEDNWNSYGTYGDTGAGSDQHQKDYGDTPFTDKSWMNPKSEEEPPRESFQTFDGKSVAVPEPKQEELPRPMSHFAGPSQDQEGLEGGADLGGAGLGNVRHHSRLLEDQKAGLLEKLDEFKENGVMPPEGEEKVFFGGENRKLVSQSPQLLGPSEGLGTALAEELLQKNKGKFHGMEDATEMVQARSDTNGLDDSRLLAGPWLDEKATQRTLMYDPPNEFGMDRAHVVLIRSHQAKDNPIKTPVKGKRKDLANKEIHEKNKTGTHDNGTRKTLRVSISKMNASKNFLKPLKKGLCKRCSSPLPLKTFSLKAKIQKPQQEQ